mmetsp:Transcript_8368/g.21398  ORF Transcript_8368/g.21398 Transcript_8368/m.21398 type:complete len:238 (-) Transcript_8368:1307-2020(-)
MSDFAPTDACGSAAPSELVSELSTPYLSGAEGECTLDAGVGEAEHTPLNGFCSVIVRSFPKATTEDDVRGCLGRFGLVLAVKVLRRRIAFADFSDAASAARAVGLDGGKLSLLGCECHVSYCTLQGMGAGSDLRQKGLHVCPTCFSEIGSARKLAQHIANRHTNAASARNGAPADASNGYGHGEGLGEVHNGGGRVSTGQGGRPLVARVVGAGRPAAARAPAAANRPHQRSDRSDHA